MMKQNNPIGFGFFEMNDATVVLSMQLNEAKEYAFAKIKDKPTAQTKNIRQATKTVEMARSVKQLAGAIANYILSHDYNENVISSTSRKI